ncbi:NADPH-dependent F420 reductase [Deinococcus oregonensis]|uniref:NADPH-dependent F420 reductase n=1 Tax=Deinococcus oregonensis TaxID=1805970 RepID=A0ABV6B502_9DEIO
MHIAILGSGIVGQTLGAKLLQLGHQVTLGTRNPDQLDDSKGMAGTLRDWQAQNGGAVATFADAAQAAELIVNASSGAATLEVLKLVGAEHLTGKVLLDIANPLDFSQGMPPSLFVKDTDSLAEQIQRAYPDVRVVKALNTMSAALMVDPQALAAGEHTVFMAGNDEAAKRQVAELLRSFGWSDLLDLGDLSAARGTEMLLPIWLRLWQTLGTHMLQFKIVR